jgi:hypothetical protein
MKAARSAEREQKQNTFDHQFDDEHETVAAGRLPNIPN